ncbi:TPA: ead/Ea22-like family protein [Salmonella enterica subsp. enterica serovar Ball]|uniref:ead/Ea22-like family protein n=1 Tax=Salmonella enterica TaxID=28901 RepID=UPI001C48AD64|nr:ead/Ea22-like family protein [Salmonella enterica]HCA3433330.1 ead/Ea22-like family protein [Salmonella enterica subsp. enterica serovar Ball]HCA3484867.1 ead/Ea22-like family protein [Salmonella enterica subsp. enterica serovar Ball]HCA3563006.1 ead/Ea22-like family protein [Salmonella enterica subsp. enterica serovar Ball]
MSNIDKQALREAATVATQGGWYVDYDFDVCHESGAFLAETHGDNLVQNAKFIAAANPATVLALLDDLDVKEEQRANWFQMARRLGEDLDAAERCIAELDERLIEYAGIATREAHRVAGLEARAVSIPEVRITVAESKRKNLTWRELGAYNEGADVAKETILAAIRTAGIKIKGE